MAPISRRICLTGPESTGKSELAERLARALRVPWVGEFAREYVDKYGGELTAEDVEPIARGQIESEERLAGAPVIVLDTNLLSTVVYARYYFGACPAWIEEEARRRRADLYLLMDTDVEWKPDPARDNDPNMREDLFDAFRATLDELECNWQIVSGDWEERWQQVQAAAKKLMG